MDTIDESQTKDQIDTREVIHSNPEETRLAFHKFTGEISSEDLSKQSLNPAWTIGEVLYHMSMDPRNLPSDVWMIRHLKWVLKIPPGPFNRLNIILTQRGARNATRESILEAYEEAHQRTLKVLESVHDGEWANKGGNYPEWDPILSGFVTLERLFNYISLHFESHRADIQEVIDPSPVSWQRNQRG